MKDFFMALKQKIKKLKKKGGKMEIKSGTSATSIIINGVEYIEKSKSNQVEQLD